MFLKGLAPQGLKGSAAAVEGVHLGEVRMLTAQVAPLDAVGGDAGIGHSPFSIISIFMVLRFQSNNLERPANKMP